MARRHIWWDEREREQRALRAARWREARARLFALPDDLRNTVRKLWRSCPYPADPTYLLDLLHQIAVGRVEDMRGTRSIRHSGNSGNRFAAGHRPC